MTASQAAPSTQHDPSTVAGHRSFARNVPTGGHDSSYVSIAPCRAVDTSRAKAGNLKKNGTRTFRVAGASSLAAQGGAATGCNVPTWATAVTANIFATSVTGTGVLHAWAAGTARPLAVALLLTKGQRSLAGVTVGTSASGVSIRPEGASARFGMDITGYYAPSIYAVVSSNGTLLYSSRLKVASHTISSGAYTLTGDTSLTNCSIVAAAWGSYDAAAYASGTSISVNTRYLGTQTADAYFQVTVTC
ncbi:hypothetical protein [Jatrophihabitans fulvus]